MDIKSALKSINVQLCQIRDLGFIVELDPPTWFSSVRQGQLLSDQEELRSKPRSPGPDRSPEVKNTQIEHVFHFLSKQKWCDFSVLVEVTLDLMRSRTWPDR